MKRIRLAGSIAAVAVMGLAISAQTPATKKKLLVIGEEKGYRHEAVTHAMVTIDSSDVTPASGTRSSAPTPKH